MAERTLNIKYAADTSQVKKSLDDMDHAHGKFGASVGKASNAVKGHFGSMVGSITGSMGPVGAALGGMTGGIGGVGLAAAGMAIGVGAAMLKSADAFVNYAGEVRKMKEITGASAEDSSRLVNVMDDMEVNADQGAKAFAKFSRSLDDGSPALDKWFSNAEQANMKGKTLTETVPDLAAKFQSLHSPIERNAFLMDTFGKSGLEMRKLLQLSGGDFKKMADEAERMGLVMSGADLTAARDYELAIDDLKDSFQGMAVTLGREVVPMLTDLADFTTNRVVPAVRGLNDVADEHQKSMRESWNPADKLIAKFADWVTGADSAARSTRNMTEAQKEAKAASNDFAAVLEAAGSKALDAWNKAGSEFDKRMDGFVVKFGDYASATADVITTNEKVVVSTKNMDAAHARHSAAMSAVEQATRRVEQAQRDYNAAHAEYKEDGTPAAERFAAARDQLAAATAELTGANGQLAAAEKDVASATKETTTVTETSVQKGKAATQALIEGMKEKTAGLETFVTGMKDLGGRVAGVADREISQAFLAKLAEMGPGANQLLAELNTMSDAKLKETVGIFGSNIQAAKAASDLQFDKYPANWSQKIQAANTAVFGKLGELVGQFNAVPEKTSPMAAGLAAQMQSTIGEILAMQQAGMIALDPLAEDSLRTAALMTDPEKKAEAIKRVLDAIPGRYNATVDVEGNWRWNAAPGPFPYRHSGWHSGGLVRHQGGPIPSMHSGGLRPDERIAKLQAGEFVIRRRAVNALGMDTLESLNSATARSMSTGGGGRGGGGTSTIVVPVSLDGQVIARVVAGPVRDELLKVGRRNGSIFGGPV